MIYDFFALVGRAQVAVANLYDELVLGGEFRKSQMVELDKPKLLILWDIDGTLVRLSDGQKNKHKLAVESVGACKLPKQSSQAGKTDLQIITELVRNYNLSPNIIQSALSLLDRLTAAELHLQPVSANVNVSVVLNAFAKCGWTNGLLTGNTRTRAKLKLQSCGLLEKFCDQFFFDGETAQNRFQLFTNVSETLCQSELTNVLVIGDTPLDIQASQTVGFPCVAVTTGSFSIDELAIHDPDLLISDLSVGFNSLKSFIEKRFVL
jgi:phosphoglycolate phosphatase